MTESTGANCSEMPPASPSASPIAGMLITETLDGFDGGRSVTVYVPRNAPEAIIFAGDGQAIATWGSMLESTDSPSTMIVGVHGLADEMHRLHEYSPVFDAERFSAHEEFFVEDVPRWVGSRLGISLPAERTAIFGYSAGAELSLVLGLGHPEKYGTVFAGSPGGGYRPPKTMPTVIPRAYLFGGTLEPFFLDNATRWARALRDAGGEVEMRELDVSHGAHFWQREFPRMIEWAFKASP